MSDLFFVWIGSGRTRKIKGIADKCVYLDKALRAGLPVPNGSIILDLFYQLALGEEVATINRDQVQIDSPVAFSDLLYESVRLPRFEKKVALRTAFSPNSSIPIVQFNCDSNDPQQLSTAVQTIWSAAPPENENIRRDFLIMDMVAVQVEGTAVLSPNNQPDHAALRNQDALLIIPPLGRWGRTDDSLPAYGRRLQKLLHGVKRTFGNKITQITWVDDGQICWLLQLNVSDT